jgi:hypothetical protein
MRIDGSLYNHRIINGLLKTKSGLNNAAAAHGLLSKNVELICDHARAKSDLWPCIWAMASALARQFAGTIYINGGLDKPLAAPVALPANCIFTSSTTPSPIRIGIGITAPELTLTIDARGNRIAAGKVMSGSEDPAHPISSFAIAGYAAFAAMATAAAIPPFRQSFASSELELPFAFGSTAEINELSLIGLGQLGQAYLSLLYFLSANGRRPRLFIVDKDEFEASNADTQILLSGADWEYKEKAKYIEVWAKSVGFECESLKEELTWGWKAPINAPKIALLGLDNFDARRMCANAGFEWLIESGVGTSFGEPKVTWHSFPSSVSIANQLFKVDKQALKAGVDAPYAAELKRTAGGCGWVMFDTISATAPSMGLVAAAYAFSELSKAAQGDRVLTAGSAYVWSPLIPVFRRIGDQAVGTLLSKFQQKH